MVESGNNFPPAPNRGNYRLFERTLTKEKVRKLLREGYDAHYIQRACGISQTSFYRYEEMIFRDERDFLEGNDFREELRRQVILGRDRLLQDRRDILKAAKDPSIEPERLKAMCDCYNYASEIIAAVLRMYAYGPTEMIVKELPSSSSSALSENSSYSYEPQPRVPFLHTKDNYEPEEELKEEKHGEREEKIQRLQSFSSHKE